MARPLALLVAAAFAVAPSVIWLGSLDADVTWAWFVFAAAYVVGAALLAVGATRWYGRRARLLRVWGFVLLLAVALVTVSFAFLLVPLVLLAIPSLRRRERDETHVSAADLRA